MKTAKGNTYTTLLNFSIENGELTVKFPVPMDTPNVNVEYIEKAIPIINERITTEKKPGATFEKCLAQIEGHRQHYIAAVVNLIETVDGIVNPVKQTRTSSADKARYEMIAGIAKADSKMFKSFAVMHLGEDKVNEYILPDDNEEVINAIVAKMKESE